MLNRAALVSKNISEDLINVFTKVTKVINYVKNNSLKVRLFSKLCEDIGANYTSLLYYCKVHLLSRAKVIQRVLELKGEIAIFSIKIIMRTQIGLGMIILLLNLLIWLKFLEN